MSDAWADERNTAATVMTRNLVAEARSSPVEQLARMALNVIANPDDAELAQDFAGAFLAWRNANAAVVDQVLATITACETAHARGRTPYIDAPINST